MGELKNIVIINDFDFVQGGASMVAIKTANLLAENRNVKNVYFFSAVHSENSTLSAKIIRHNTNQKEFLHYHKKIKGALAGLYNFEAKKELKKLLQTLSPSETVVHIHGWTKALSSSVFDAAKECKFPVVITLHDYFLACPNGGFFNFNKCEICHQSPNSLKCIFSNCDSRNIFFKWYRNIRLLAYKRSLKGICDFISISELNENLMRKFLHKNASFYRIYNPIDYDENEPIVDFHSNDLFLYVGRISAEKGVELFCKATQILNVKAVAIGDGEDLPRLKKTYQNVDFVGWKNQEEIKSFLKKARVLIFPSLLYESAGLSPLEALSYGVPSIIKSSTAAREYLSAGVNGTLFSDLDDLIFQMKNIDTVSIDRSILNKFSTVNYQTHLLQVYNVLLTKNK